MDRFIKKTLFVDGCVKEALDIAKSKEKTRENYDKFDSVCKAILAKKDDLMAYSFASKISYLLDEDYERVFSVGRFEDVVIEGRNPECIYAFGREVKGANIKRIIANLPNGKEKSELKKDQMPVEETL